LGTVEDLLSLGAGGGSVAKHLLEQDNELQAIGYSPAGVDLAIKSFLSALEDGTQCVLFMVGGPGGGKSHAAKRLVSNFKEIDTKSSKLAHRVHRYEDPKSGSKVTVINDATIGEETGEQFPLVKDLDSAFTAGDSLIVCVNRGVLVEESRCQDPLLADSVRLVQNVSTGKSTNGELDSLSTNNLSSYFYWYEDNLNSRTILVFQVSFDICSLFESDFEDERFVPNSNSTGSLQEMTISKFRDRFGETELTSKAAKLLQSTVELVKADFGDLLAGKNPISANLHSLSQKSIINGIMSVARAAEIAHGQRLTYRELWAILSKVILGAATDATSKQDLISNMQKHSFEGASFERFCSLAGSRFSQSLFASDFEFKEDIDSGYSGDPVASFMQLVDPFRDMAPGNFYPNEGKIGWATPVSEAFSGSADDFSPLKELLVLDDLNNGVMKEVVHEFDWALDKAFSVAVADSKLESKTRITYISWYSGYLARLYAVSNGIPAFLSVIDAWTDLWNKAPLIPEELKTKLLTLAKPSRNPENKNSSSLIPLFDSRTVPVTSENSEPKLALKVDDVSIKTSKQANNLFLELWTGNKSAGLILDFSLLREAMASAAGYSGVTESSSLAAPRLERFRASSLVSKSASDFVVMFRDKEVEFQVEGGAE